jgi:hypothetical protein
MATADLTAARLREIFDYDPDTGIMTSKRRAGRPVGTQTRQGYLRVLVGKDAHMVHRLAWLWVHGHHPSNTIDHINGIRDDNRIANLRDVHPTVNTQNQTRAQRTNALGVLGVNQLNRKFRAGIRVNGKRIHLGMFHTPEAAHAAYVEAKRIHHEGCTL